MRRINDIEIDEVKEASKKGADEDILHVSKFDEGYDLRNGLIHRPGKQKIDDNTNAQLEGVNEVARGEKLNEEREMNNNLSSSTYGANSEIRQQHQKPKLTPRKRQGKERMQMIVYCILS